MKKTLTIISGIGLYCAFILKQIGSPELVIKFSYLSSIIAGSYFVLLNAFACLLKKHFLNFYSLLIIAVIGAIYINQLAEAAAVIFFASLAEIFKDYGIERSRKALETLIRKSPQEAILLNGKKVPIDDIQVKEIVVVRPGDLVPLDGIIIKGSSSIDESTITGEYIPKDKIIGDSVFAGTININGYLEVEVTKKNKNSTFAKIISLVEQAQLSRAQTQDLIDLIAKYYTPIVVIGAILITIIPLCFFGGAFNTWLYKALILLVISCPCALVISTPVAIASAIGGATHRGILIKDGKHLELLGKIKAIAFDKTKTLTLGEPTVSEVVTLDKFSIEEVLAHAAGIEKFSSHPLAKSIMNFAEEHGIMPHLMENYENIPGMGDKAICLECGNLKHYIGNLKLVGANSFITKELLAKIEDLEKEGKTIVLASKENQVIGFLSVSDKIRSESREVIQKLNLMGIETAIITGDNPYSANFIAKILGNKRVYASLLPEEKARVIEELKRCFIYVAMVGDGVNDAPSLAASTVGISMGTGGSDIAMETADITLMNNNILNIPYVIKLGRKTLKTIKQNIFIALTVKAVFFILALFGYTHIEYAIGADSGVAILLILNSLALFNFKDRK